MCELAYGLHPAYGGLVRPATADPRHPLVPSANKSAEHPQLGFGNIPNVPFSKFANPLCSLFSLSDLSVLIASIGGSSPKARSTRTAPSSARPVRTRILSATLFTASRRALHSLQKFRRVRLPRRLAQATAFAPGGSASQRQQQARAMASPAPPRRLFCSRRATHRRSDARPRGARGSRQTSSR